MAVLAKSSRRSGESGSVTLEFALALPVLAIVVVGGALVIALTITKAELTAVAFEAARAEAVTDASGYDVATRVVAGFRPGWLLGEDARVSSVKKSELQADVRLTLPVPGVNAGSFTIDPFLLSAEGVAAR